MGSSPTAVPAACRRHPRERSSLGSSVSLESATPHTDAAWIGYPAFGLRQGQPEMLDALLVLVEGDDIGDGLLITLIVTHDELQCTTHTRASPGSSDR